MKKQLFVACAAALAAVGCSPKKTAGTQQEQSNEKVAVKTVTAEGRTVGQIVDFTANLLPEKQSFICPSLAVRIDEILVEVGDPVEKGQLLVVMDKNQYNQSALQLANNEVDLARLKAVYQSGGVSKQQIDQLETSVGVMRESLEDLEKNVELRSPIDGVVTGRFNEVGDLFTMSPNSAGGVGILQVMQINPLKAIVAIPEQYYPIVKTGMPVEIKVETFPDRTFNGKVSIINPSINSSTRTFDVEVAIPNASRTLRPGMYARTVFNMGEKEGVAVNDLAVQKQVGTNEKYVYVIRDGKAERRTVITGPQQGDVIEIVSGLEPGEQVAVAGISRLSNGTEVEVRNE